MCGLQPGFVAAQSLGLLQTAEGGKGGGRPAVRVFGAFGTGRSDNSPRNLSVGQLLVGWLRILAGHAGSKPLAVLPQQLSGKGSFFNGLVACRSSQTGKS